jgi:hypothetical protein
MAQRKYNDPITFDTLSYSKRLKAAGFTQEQAEVQAETFLAIVQEQLVSKRDLKELEKEIKLEIEDVRKELKLEIRNLDSRTQNQIELLRRDLKIWFGGMLVVAVSVLSGMMTLIVHLAR